MAESVEAGGYARPLSVCPKEWQMSTKSSTVPGRHMTTLIHSHLIPFWENDTTATAHTAQTAQTPWWRQEWGCLQDKTLELDTSSLDTENILFQLFILSHWTGLNQISTTNSQKSPINSQHILLQKIGVFNEYFTLLMSVKSEMCQKIIRFFNFWVSSEIVIGILPPN